MKNIAEKFSRSFWWFNTTQFLGALNDNIFKLLVVYYWIGSGGAEQANRVQPIAQGLTVLPFIIFLAYAGRLADRYSKRNLIIITKAAEVVVMILAVLAFWSNLPVAIGIVLLLMYTQSAFFSPNKYGIICDLVEPNQVARANGWVGAFTYIAVLLGTILAPKISDVVSSHYVSAAMVCVFIAIAGLVFSIAVKTTRPAGGQAKSSVLFFRDIVRTIWSVHRKKILLWSIIGSSYFTFVGVSMYFCVIPYGMSYFGLTKENSTYLFIFGLIGIAYGALVSGRCKSETNRKQMIPLGTLVLGLSALLVGFTRPGYWLMSVILFFMGMGAGLFIVPINTYIQIKSPDHRRGEIIAASEFLSWISHLIAVGVFIFLTQVIKLNSAQLFIFSGLIAVAAAVIISIYNFESVVRFSAAVLTRFIYRLKVYGSDNIPKEGGALIICNHASYADPAILDAAQSRPVYFLMYRDFYNLAFMKPFCKLCRTIPISSNDSLSQIRDSIRRTRQLLDEGKLVCIFPEGGMTRNGNLGAFKNGFELIVKGTDCKIIPVYIAGTWKSCMSYYYGKPLSSLPRGFRPPVSVHFGKAQSCDVTLQELRQKVTELSCDYYESLKSPKRNLAYRFIKTARKNWWRRCISDVTGKKFNYSRTLAGAVVLSKYLKQLTGKQEKIGILLPPSVGAALTNIAITILGKVPVNLNYSAGINAVNTAIEKCGIKTIITSAVFLEKIPEMKALPNPVFLENIVSQISRRDKLAGYFKAMVMPACFITEVRGRSADDLATVIFSSGSSGEPKGIMLSHHNIISNIESMLSVFKLKRNDNLCAMLPFFHSFGFVCSFWLPIIGGVSASYIPNPLDGKLVGRTASKNNSTILFAAPTFLLNYIRRTDPQDFSKLRFVIAGAEKLQKSVADEFEKKFAVRPKEGYGATELSPVLSLNLPDDKNNDSVQPGSKTGTVGHPVPGCAVKVVDPQTQEILSIGQDGLLLVKSPNVMLGYINDPQQTQNVLKDGWYNTGDIARVDEDGFITITDRLSRFSKIAGEMVPHIAIEDILYKAFDVAEPMVAVTCVPDEKKGEELVVLCSQNAPDIDKLYNAVAQSNLPNLWKPKRENYIRIDKLPALGSGKLDLSRIKTIAISAKSSQK